MIIKDLKKFKDRSYILRIDNEEYILDEEIILEYRLVKNKEIDSSLLVDITAKNNLIKLYKKALDYSLRYNKNTAQIFDYLIDNGATNKEAAYIIEKLLKIKAINDEKLIDLIVYSLVKKGNGKLLIEKKLYEKQFSSDLIANALNSIDSELYFEELNKLFLKAKNKYNDDDLYVKNMKIKKYLLSRGYTYNDLENINFKGE